MRPQILTHTLVSFFLLLFPCYHTLARLVNVTIDDSGIDPMSGNRISYTPAEGWKTKDCDECTAQLDEARMYGRTWHDSTFNPGPGNNGIPNQPLFARFSFIGSALYIVCALARTEDHPAGHNDMTFLINDTVIGTFRRDAPRTTGYDYNQIVFSSTTLPLGLHSLAIQNGHVSGEKSLILLDAIIYTSEVDESSMPATTTSPIPSSPPPPIGAIVGGVVGGLAFLLILASTFYLYYRRRKQPVEEPHENIIHPVILGPISRAAALLPNKPTPLPRNEPLAAQQLPFANATVISDKPSAPFTATATSSLNVIYQDVPPAYSDSSSGGSSR